MRLDLALVIGLILLVDQFTKFLASTYLTYAEPIGVLPFFSLTLLHNTGAAFSFLADASGWQRWFFLTLAVGVSGYSIWSLRNPGLCRWMQTGFVLLIPGAIGNGVDRVAFGYVVDFLHFHWGSWSFPAFNIADTSITLAAGCLLIGWYLDARHRSKLQG
ncbi:MAG TPA: signal peptidase II [Gammaproteobacteria bacterium]|nr:signal peptidase II [Gammaproteobacteria bacterium]